MNRNLFIRLTFAAHRVADALPDEELKQEIKESANTILADLVLFGQKEGVLKGKKQELLPQLMRQIDVLLVYLDKAKREGWVQSQNFSVLEVEYGRIKDSLEFFEGAREDSQEEYSRLQKKDEKKEQPIAVKEVLKEKNGLSERQRKIIEFLKNKDTAQVWELQKILPQVTKRTLRRDLDSLLQLNLVERKGEWNSVVYELKETESVQSGEKV